MTVPATGSARFLIVGPQGSGKGTQGVRVAEAFGVPSISTGDVFRENISGGTELGRRVQAIVEAGDLVSDELTCELVRDRLSQTDAARGFLLDGFPRNRAQVDDLDEFLASRGESLDAVIELSVPREESIARLRQRAIDQGRTDDTEEVIANRLAIYERETAPILDVYRDHGLVVQVDGVGTLDEVTERIFAALAARGLEPARPDRERLSGPSGVFRRSLYKSPAELRSMRAAGAATAAALDEARRLLRPGATPLELDAAAERVIRNLGGRPNFQLVPGYRHTLCVSVDDDVVHGIPGDRPFRAGDIVSVDGGAEVGGWNGDAAFTMVLPDAARPGVVAARETLSAVTEQALWHGIAALAGAGHLNEVGAAIEDYVRGEGEYGILTDYVGHGIGRSMHEEPPVFNYRVDRRGAAVKPGLVVAIEPMIVAGSIDTFVRDDEWTVTTADGADAAHWEHSVAVHEGGIWVLTAADGGAAGLAPLGVEPVPIR